MEIACLVDDVGVLVLCLADVDERAVPVLEGEPLEFAVLSEIEEGDSVHSFLVGVAGDVDSFVVPCPAAAEAGRTIVYRSAHCLTSRLHILDAYTTVLLIPCPPDSHLPTVTRPLQPLAVPTPAPATLPSAP